MAICPAWQTITNFVDVVARLASCLKNTRAAAKVWSRRNKVPPLFAHNLKFIILMLDFLEEYRILSNTEMQVRELCQSCLHQHIKEIVAYWKQRITNYSSKMMGEPGTSTWTFNIQEIYNGRPYASDNLIALLSNKEAITVVRSMNKMSAAGHYGFVPIFYSSAWPTVRQQ